MTAHGLTTADLLASIYTALSIRAMERAGLFICALQRVDPEAAQRILDAIHETDAKYAARRGDALWAEHVAEQNAGWWQ